MRMKTNLNKWKKSRKTRQSLSRNKPSLKKMIAQKTIGRRTWIKLLTKSPKELNMS